MTKQLKINPAPGSYVRPRSWTGRSLDLLPRLPLLSHSTLIPGCLLRAKAWGQSDLELVPPKIKARHTDYKVVQAGGGGVGEKEPSHLVG